MSKHDDGLSFIVVPNSGGQPRAISLSRRRIRFLAAGGAVVAAAIVLMAATWVLMARRAARSDDLARQVDSLTIHQTRLNAVAEQLARVQAKQDTKMRLLGLSGSADSALWFPAPSGAARRNEARPAVETGSEPTTWPLTVAGAVTQAHFGGAAEDHPGIDIAVATGSYVRAAGGGEVVQAADDPVYGLFVLIDHGDGMRTRYGHASYLIARRGWRVRRGEVIALSGSTGASTAPHLHFEILKDGQPVDPFTMVTPP